MCGFNSDDKPSKIQDPQMQLTSPLIPKTTCQESRKRIHHHRFSLAFLEAKQISNIAFPMVLTGLLMYSRSMISMLFLGRLGELSLAGGSLALGFANITGYSVLSGLAMGMEPICGQAFGAKRHKLLALALRKTVILLLLTSVPISILWVNMKRILLFCGQEAEIAEKAQSFILCSVPDLIAQSLLHPLRIYLRSQSITLPLTYCASFAVLLHIPINYLLVSVFDLGIQGVALGSVWTNLNFLGALIVFIIMSGVYEQNKGEDKLSSEFLEITWKSLLNLAVPSCVSVCLEWWWYEIMILLCGFLLKPQATVASMGILIQTTSLIYIFPSSLSFGVSTRVGNELGANRSQRAKLSAIVGLSLSFLLGFCALSFALMVKNIWAKMFTQDEEIIALTSMVLPIIGLCELGNCPQTTSCGVLRGTARPRLGANINLGCFYFVGMPIALWLSFEGGFDFKGLWLGLLAAQGSCVLTMLAVLARTNWEVQAQRAKQLTGSVAIENYHEEVEDHLEKLKGERMGLLVNLIENDDLWV